MRVEALGQHQVSREHDPAWPTAAGEHLPVHLMGMNSPANGLHADVYTGVSGSRHVQ